MEGKTETGDRRLSAADVLEAARNLEEIKRLDDEAIRLIERMVEGNRLGECGEKIRNAIGPNLLGRIGSDVLGAETIAAVLRHMAGERAVRAGRIVDIVEVPARVWDPETVLKARRANG
jgi:hypothetical protein